MHINIHPKKISITLAFIIFVLVIAHLAASLLVSGYSLQPDTAVGMFLGKFNLNNEVGLGTWFSQIILFVAGLLLFAIGLHYKKTQSSSMPWLILGVIFIYMSVDEGAALHELASYPTRYLLGGTSGIFTFAWVIPALIAVAVFGLTFFKFWLSLPAKIRGLFLISAAIYITGAVGLEMIGAAYYGANPGSMLNVTVSDSLIAIEEGLEMSGVTIFIYSILSYMKTSILVKKNDRLSIDITTS